MKFVSVLLRIDNIENRKLCSELKNVSVMDGRSQQKGKRVAQSCSKLTDLFTNSRSDDQSSTNESLNDVASKNMQKESGEQKLNYFFSILYLLLRILDVFRYEIHASFSTSSYN